MTTIIISFIAGAAIAWAGALVLFRRKANALNAGNVQLQNELAARQRQLEMAQRQLQDSEANANKRIADLHDSYQQQLDKAEALRRQTVAEMRQQADDMMRQAQTARQQALDEADKRHSREMQEVKGLMDKQLQDSFNLVQERLNKSTEQLLRQRSADLRDTNSMQMKAIVDPLKETIAEMKKAMDDNRESFVKSSSALNTRIDDMFRTTSTLGREAEKLSKALQTGPKLQGDFGEMKLNDLLDRFGFTRGLEYDVQATITDGDNKAVLNDDSNQRMRPDVVLHYPDRRDVIIDSKASFTAFISYSNASTDEERSLFMAEHVASVRRHVDELADKNYGKYSINGGTTLDFVIMFVPHEGALQLAMYSDPKLWSYAFDKHVLITGEQNLFALLRLLQLAWTQQHQADNQEKVFGLASTLVDRVGLFMQRFDKLGKALDSAISGYDDAQKSLNGNQSFLTSARKLVAMGAKENPKRRLPQAPAGEDGNDLADGQAADGEAGTGSMPGAGDATTSAATDSGNA